MASQQNSNGRKLPVRHLDLKSHCLFCLQSHENDEVAAGLNRNNPRNIQDIQAIMSYLTGTDPMDEKGRKIPKMETLPPVCSRCYNSLADLHELHEQLINIQAMIQRQTENFREIVKETVTEGQGKSSWAQFVDKIVEGGMTAMQPAEICSFVKGVHDAMINEDKNGVIFASRAPVPPAATSSGVPVDTSTFSFADLLDMESLSPAPAPAPAAQMANSFGGQPLSLAYHCPSASAAPGAPPANLVFVTPTPMASSQIGISPNNLALFFGSSNQASSYFAGVNPATMWNTGYAVTPSGNFIQQTSTQSIPDWNYVPAAPPNQDRAKTSNTQSTSAPGLEYYLLEPRPYEHAANPSTSEGAMAPSTRQELKTPPVTQASSSNAASPACPDKVPIEIKVVKVYTGNNHPATPPGQDSVPSSPKSGQKVSQACNICGAHFSLNAILQHMKSHIGDYAVECLNPECTRAFSSRISLVRHLCASKTCKAYVNINGIKMHDQRCSACGFQTSVESYWENHLKDHEKKSKEKNFECPIPECSSRFALRQSVELHIASHNFKKSTLGPKEKKSKVVGRGKKLLSEPELPKPQQHGRKTKPKKEKKPYVCGTCAKKFPSEENLNKHRLARCGRPNLMMCPVCKKTYLILTAFENHLKTHDGNNNGKGDGVKLLE